MLRTTAATLGCLLLVALSATASVVPDAPKLGAKGYMLMDFASGDILAEKAATERLEPASLTKLMTAYIAFAALADGRASSQDEVFISEKAWRTPGSRMFVEAGSKVPLELLLKGMIIQSGNDASVAIAEHLAGSEGTFAELMNATAAELGMTASNFENSTGLPGESHYTTPQDILRLARALIADFPQYYRWYSEREFTYNEITQHNRNSLLWRDDSVDGVKTGHTDAAGYCLVSSASRNGMRLLGVVMGTESAKARADASQALLNYGFRFFESHRLYAGGEAIATAPVFKGELEQTDVGLSEDLHVTVPRGRYDELTAEMNIERQLIAPLGEGQEVGSVNIVLDGQVVATRTLHTIVGVAEGSLWQQLKDEVRLWME